MPSLHQNYKSSLFRYSSTVAIAVLLGSCGGGGGGGSSSNTGGTTAGTCQVNPASSTPFTTGTALPLATINNYTGSNTGIWSASNTNSTDASVTVDLNSVAGKNVTLVWTNTTAQSSSSAPKSASSYIEGGSGNDLAAGLHKRIAEDKARMRQALIPASSNSNTELQKLTVKAAYALNDSRNWYESANSKTIDTTLHSQGSLSSGNKLNIWVQNSEWNASGGSYKVSQSSVDTLRDKFATSQTGIFDMVTNVSGGKPWGTTAYTNLIGASQDIHIVVTNFDSNQTPMGLLGYFHGMNNYLKSTYSNSNEALVFFIDSETLASTLYQDKMVSVLAHEFVHMINFYERDLENTGFDTWLEETSAMMMQDILDTRLSNTYHNLRDVWFPNWLGYGAYNCRLTDYIEDYYNDCFSYDIGGSYGGFLLRQYGLGFYKNLMQSTSGNSITAMDTAIKQTDATSSFTQSLQRWGASIALLDINKLPAGYGYPAKTESVNSVSYTLKAINGPDFANDRCIDPVPANLVAYGHAAQTFTSTASNFYRKVLVPPGVTLTVIVN